MVQREIFEGLNSNTFVPYILITNLKDIPTKGQCLEEWDLYRACTVVSLQDSAIRIIVISLFFFEEKSKSPRINS